MALGGVGPRRITTLRGGAPASTAGTVRRGPGNLGLDAALGHRVNRPWMRVVGLATIPDPATQVFRRHGSTLAAAADGPGSGEPAPR